MSYSKIVKIVIGLLVVALSIMMTAATPSGGSSEHRNVVYDGANAGLEDPIPLPGPIELPPDDQITVPHEIQMVGYTMATLPTNRGILNMTRACQSEFPGTRVCTVDEVLASFVVPDPPYGAELTYIWARSAGTVAGKLLGRTQPDAAAVDCRGWTSMSRGDTGVAIALGPNHACHGGVVEMTCDAELRLACCGFVN